MIRVLTELRRRNMLEASDSILTACAGHAEIRLFSGMGYLNVTHTNLDTECGTVPRATSREHPKTDNVGSFSQADVQALPYPNEEFDWTFVSDGLHHVSRPHLALTELYRVAKKGVLVIESRDGFFMRFARKLGFTHDFEINWRLLSTRTSGGKDFGPIPNFVYRWTESEFEKTITSFEPAYKDSFFFFYGLCLPRNFVEKVPWFGPLAEMAARIVVWLFPRQGNTFAMVAAKTHSLRPWLTATEEGPRLRSDISSAREAFRLEKTS